MKNDPIYLCCVTSHLKMQQHKTTTDSVCQELGRAQLFGSFVPYGVNQGSLTTLHWELVGLCVNDFCLSTWLNYGVQILNHYSDVSMKVFLDEINIFKNGCTCSIWKLLGQGLNLSHSYNLHHSCGNAGSFNLLHQAGD